MHRRERRRQPEALARTPRRTRPERALASGPVAGGWPGGAGSDTAPVAAAAGVHPAQRPAYSLAPGYLTCALAKGGAANGVIQAWDSLCLPNRPCGWLLLTSGCKPKPGMTCSRSHQLSDFDPAQVAKIKAACTPAMLAQLH